MNKKELKPIEAIREERFVETDAKAIEVLSKEESDRVRKNAEAARKGKKAKVRKSGAR